MGWVLVKKRPLIQNVLTFDWHLPTFLTRLESPELDFVPTEPWLGGFHWDNGDLRLPCQSRGGDVKRFGLNPTCTVHLQGKKPMTNLFGSRHKQGVSADLLG